MIGHNGGPSIEAGYGFRKHAWGKAREALLPKLPIEIVRVRVARARRLGLPYRTYAGIRAATGRDVVAFLFSGNALELTAHRIEMPAQVAGDWSDCTVRRPVLAPSTRRSTRGPCRRSIPARWMPRTGPRGLPRHGPSCGRT